MIMLDYEQIGRVLHAIEQAGGDVPTVFYPAEDCAEMDTLRPARTARYNLAHDISLAFHRKSMQPFLTSDALRSRRTEALTKLRRSAREVSELLASEDLRLWGEVAFKGNPFPDRMSFPEFVGLCKSLERAVGERLEFLKKTGSRDKAPASVVESIQPHTPNTAFYNKVVNCYRTHLGEVGFTYDAEREPGGPFVAFVQAVLKEYGQNVPTPAAIKKALQRAA